MTARAWTRPAGTRRVQAATCSAFLVVSFALAAADARAAEPPTPEGQPAPPGVEEAAKVACFKHHEDAQIARRERHLLEARSGFRLCSRASCPGAIRADCVNWFEEVNRSIPSVVVTARARGRDVTDVKVFVDGVPVADRLTGAAFEFDPGEHRFVVQSPPWPPQEHTVLMSEGVKGREIDIEFSPPPPATAAETTNKTAKPADPPRKMPLHPPNRFDYIVGGAGVASLATAAAVGGWALWLRHHYENTCAPFCGDAEKSSVRTKFLIADAALGLAVVSAVAVYLHLSRPHASASVTAGAANGVSLMIGGADHRAQVGIRGTF